MREFSLTLSEMFRNGLRQDGRLRRNQDLLSDVYNLRSIDGGLEGFEPPIPAFPDAVVIDFDDCQLFKGESVTLYISGVNLYTVNTASPTWTLTAVTTYDYLSPTSTKAIATGGAWHFADFKDKWLLFNGTCIVTNIGLDKLKNETEKVYVIDSISVATGCAFKGRLVFGGFNPANFWGADWVNVFDYWKETMNFSGELSYDDVGANWVAWTSIGDIEFFESLLSIESATHGTNLELFESVSEHRLNKFNLIDMMRKGDFGFAPLSTQADVIALIPMTVGVVAYTEDSVFLMRPFEGNEVAGPTFGFEKISDVGINDRGAVGGVGSQHIFIANTGNIYSVTAEQVTKLGYEEYLNNNLNGKHFVNYEPDEGHFLLADVARGYVLGDKGLTIIPQRISSVVHVRGESRALYEEKGESDIITGYAVSNPFDMRMSSIKTITSIQLNYYNGVNVKVAVSYKYTPTDTWATTAQVPVNREGNAMLRIAGTEFKVHIFTDDITDFMIDEVFIKYQTSDKRFTRGAYVDTGNA